MSFPFSGPARELRQRILLVLGASGLLGISGIGGCDPAPSCDGEGPPTKTCLTRSQMDDRARIVCSGGPQATCVERSAAEIAAQFDDDGCLLASQVTDGCCNDAVRPGDPQADGSCCYYHCTPHVCCGRPLLVADESRLASVAPREDWLLSSAYTGLDRTVAARERIAHEWLEDARMEHASVAAFARFTLELLGFAAPAELVAEAQRAGFDEISHALACFSLAQRYDGVARGPARLDLSGLVPASSLPDAVRCAFLEGCVGETQAALLARHALLGARDPQVREALEQIAADEARHAVLAWRFVAWAVHEDPRCAHAVEAALAHVLVDLSRQTLDNARPESGDTRAQLHSAGRLTAAERAAIARESLANVIVPCARAVLALCESGRARHDVLAHS